MCGVLASTASPSLLVRSYLRRELEKYPDWKIEGKEVLIVGAGIGGLTCGALLAKYGYRVTVFEQHYVVGGYCTSFRRKDFYFDAGVESISGLWEKGPLKNLLDELGIDWKDLFVRTREAYILNGELIEIPEDYKEFIELLTNKFPEEADNIRRFFSDVKKVFLEIYMDVDKTYGVPIPLPLIYKVLGFKYIFDYPKTHPHFYSWKDKSFQQVLDEYFKNNDLKRLLSTLTSYLGTPPEKTSASSMAIIYGYYIVGGHYPRGGSQAYANLLADFIKKNGGRILLRHRVEKILVDDGKVKGLVANGKVFKGDVIVFNGNVKQLPNLVDNLPSSFLEQIRRLKPSVTAFLTYLGLDADLSSYPPLIKDLDQRIGIVINSNLDRSLAPEKHSSLTIVNLLPQEKYDYFSCDDHREYIRKKREFAEKLISKAEKIIPGLRRHIVIMDAATPITFERYTLNYRGAIYAFDQSIEAPPRPYFKTPIRGLYLVGASTFPGGGIEAVTISGMIAARDIMGWRKGSGLDSV